MERSHKLRAVIVDDEYPARLMMKSLAANHADVMEVVAEAKNATEAVGFINQSKPDVVFLDINMPDLNGFELLPKLEYQPFIIFTTAYEQYAIQAFEAHSIDYLLKPIDEKRFAQSIQKLLHFVRGSATYADLTQIQMLVSQLQQNKKPTAIPIKIGDKFIFVRLEDVVLLEARDKYVYVITAVNKEYLSGTRLAEFELILPSHFIRVQKSYIINVDFILEVHKYFGNRLVITMNDKNRSRLTTGSTYINQIRKHLSL